MLLLVMVLCLPHALDAACGLQTQGKVAPMTPRLPAMAPLLLRGNPWRLPSRVTCVRHFALELVLHRRGQMTRKQ